MDGCIYVCMYVYLQRHYIATNSCYAILSLSLYDGGGMYDNFGNNTYTLRTLLNLSLSNFDLIFSKVGKISLTGEKDDGANKIRQKN